MASNFDIDVLCDVLSFFVTLMGTVTKMPQIYSVFKAKSTEGISFSSILAELIGHSILLTYNFALRYPVFNYSEYVLQVPQDFLLVTLYLFYNNLLDIKITPFYLLYFVVYSMIAFRKLPFQILKSVIFLATPIIVSSRFLQIHTLLTNKDSGQLSLITRCLTGTASSVRLFTTLVRTGDVGVAGYFVFSLTLNYVLAALIFYYRNPKKKESLRE